MLHTLDRAKRMPGGRDMHNGAKRSLIAHLCRKGLIMQADAFLKDWSILYEFLARCSPKAHKDVFRERVAWFRVLVLFIMS